MVPRFDFIGLVVADLAASLAFYRRLGLDIPADAESSPHVELTLPGGLRIAWDTEDTIRSFDESWVRAVRRPPHRPGVRLYPGRRRRELPRPRRVGSRGSPCRLGRVLGSPDGWSSIPTATTSSCSPRSKSPHELSRSVRPPSLSPRETGEIVGVTDTCRRVRRTKAPAHERECPLHPQIRFEVFAP